MKNKLFLLFALIISTNVFSQSNIQFSNSGYIHYQDQNFSFYILLVNDFMEALENWNLYNTPENIKHTATVRVDEGISVFIIYATNNESIFLTYNLRLNTHIRPFTENLFISNRVISEQTWHTANEMMTVNIDQYDEIGRYNFIVEIFNYDDLIQNLT